MFDPRSRNQRTRGGEGKGEGSEGRIADTRSALVDPRVGGESNRCSIRARGSHGRGEGLFGIRGEGRTLKATSALPEGLEQGAWGKWPVARSQPLAVQIPRRLPLALLESAPTRPEAEEESLSKARLARLRGEPGFNLRV